MARLFLFISFCLFSCLLSAKEDPYSVPVVSSIENKLYEPSSELNFQVGLLPLDAFYKGLLANISYATYYKSYWGWEVLNASVAFTSDTGLRNELRNFNVQESSYLDYVNYTVSSNLIYTPIYNKNLIFNEKLVYGEISFLGGGGMAAFKSGKTAPMVGGGIVLRFFSSERWSWKFDNRAYYHFQSGLSTNVILSINIGLAYEFDPGSGHQKQTK